MEIYTPGYWKGRDSAEDFKLATIRKMSAITQPGWVNKEDIYDANKKNPIANILSVPVCWPNIGIIGEYFIGHGYRPYIQGGAITTFEGMVNARRTGRFESVSRLWTVGSGAAGQWSQLFSDASLPGTSGTFTTVAGVVPRSTSAGALQVSSLVSSANTKYLYKVGISNATTAALFMLTDILWGSSGLSMGTSGALTVNSTALIRYNSTISTAPNYIGGNLAVAWISSALAVATSGVFSAYTNQAGNAGNVSEEWPVTSAGVVNTLRPVGQFAAALAAGDIGVQSIQTYTNRVASPTSGSMGFIIHRPVMFIPSISTGSFVEKEFILGPEAMIPIQLENNSTVGCYSLMAFTPGSAPGGPTLLTEWIEG